MLKRSIVKYFLRTGSILLFSMVVVISSPGQSKIGQWKGSTKSESGVRIVSNPKKPMFRDVSSAFVLELTIGETDSSPNFNFIRLSDLLVDDKGNIYALDSKDANIKVFSAEGQLLRIIGQQGQGPGELLTPVSMDLLSPTELVVMDARSRRLTSFDLNGNYRRSISSAKHSMGVIKTDSTGNIYSIVLATTEYARRNELQKFDANLNPLNTIDFSPIIEEQNVSLFAAGPRFTVTGNGLVWYGYPNPTYEIRVYNNEGSLVMRVLRENVSSKIPKEEVKAATQGIPQGLKVYIPEYYAPYYDIEDNGNGRIIVLTRYLLRENAYLFDIYDDSGRYIETKEFRPNHRASCFRWKNDKLYVVEENDSGLPVIKKYSVKWAAGQTPN